MPRPDCIVDAILPVLRLHIQCHGERRLPRSPAELAATGRVCREENGVLCLPSETGTLGAVDGRSYRALTTAKNVAFELSAPSYAGPAAV